MQPSKEKILAHIDYYMIPISPFAYLAGDQLERIATKHGATVSYKPFNLLQVFDQTGTPRVQDRHPSRQAYRLQEIARIAKRNALPVNAKPAFFPTNPVPASCAIIAAQNTGGGDVGHLVQLLLGACFAQERDIASDDVIRDCLTLAGFDPNLADQGMLSGVQVYETNTEEALARGVFGSPTYVVNDQVFWGQDRLSYLDEYLGELG
jgi:2-hydroxychromene-2-carboxylate isomerase